MSAAARHLHRKVVEAEVTGDPVADAYFNAAAEIRAALAVVTTERWEMPPEEIERIGRVFRVIAQTELRRAANKMFISHGSVILALVGLACGVAGWVLRGL